MRKTRPIRYGNELVAQVFPAVRFDVYKIDRVTFGWKTTWGR